MKKIFLSAILAGAVIAFGGTVFLSVENTVVGSLFFTIGLFVVCTRGLHLFTGKVCYVFDNDMAYAKTLPVIWLGNLTGTSLIALAEKCTRLVSLSARAQGICELKLSEPLFGASIVTAGVFQGAGSSLLSSVLNFVSMWGVRITLTLLLVPHWGLRGAWTAMCIELCFRGSLFLFFLWRKRWLPRELV